MDVAVVIPVFNQAQYTRTCLELLAASGVPAPQTVVVDNGSTDDTSGLLSARPDLRVIRNEANRGCGAAWTQGAKILSAEWTVLLNNDVLIPPGWLDGLVGFAERERVDVVSPGICHGKNDYDFSSFAEEFMTTMAAAKRRGAASGVCFMVHRRVFDRIGFFDGDPQLGGYEDDEFFRRCRSAGFRLATTGRSFLHHFGSITQKAMKAEMGRPDASLGNREYYRKKTGQSWLRRHKARYFDQGRNAWWRATERLRYGKTLVVLRENSRFVWR